MIEPAQLCGTWTLVASAERDISRVFPRSPFEPFGFWQVISQPDPRVQRHTRLSAAETASVTDSASPGQGAIKS